MIALLAVTAGCSSQELAPEPKPPPIPAHVVNEQLQHDSPYLDDPFDGEQVTLFRSVDTLGDLDVVSLAAVGSRMFAGTATDLYALDEGQAAFAAIAIAGSGAVLDLQGLPDGRMLVLRGDEVVRLAADGSSELALALTGLTARAIAGRGDEIYVGADEGLFRVDGGSPQLLAGSGSFPIRDIAVVGDVAWLATAAGIQRYDLVQLATGAPLTAPLLVDDDVRALTVTSDGTAVVAASADGHARVTGDGSSAERVTAGIDGLPNGDLRAIAEHDGLVLSGHGIGATAMASDGTKDHYHSLRWLPDEVVTAVALADDGSRWIGTGAGLARISLQSDTLEAKAADFEIEVQNDWRLDGIVSDEVRYDDPWDPTGEPLRPDEDNDGLWTEMQVAAWCYGYAVTGDTGLYDKARKAMDAMLLFEKVPGATFVAQGLEPGFITRSLVRPDDGVFFEDKKTQDNWHLQELDGKTYYWKDDTSSDEYTGHFFGIPISTTCVPRASKSASPSATT